jgi:hypothetical protein
MPSSGSGSAIRPVRKVGHDRAREQPGVLVGLLAGLAALYVLPTMIAVIRHVESIGLVVFLNCLPIAWPAALVVACMMPGRDDQ